MIELTLARRYAEALLDVAVERECVREIEDQISWLGDFYHSDQNLKKIVENPLVEEEEKVQFVKETFADHMCPEIINFLELLIEKKRAVLIPEIARMYDDLADDYRGLVQVDVKSSRPLAEDTKEKLTSELRRLLGGQEVEVNTEVDSDLLAGIRIRIGDYVLDGSLAGRLSRLQESLAERTEI